MESRIVRLFKVSFNLTQTHEVSNCKSQKTKLFHNMYYMTLLHYKFSQKEKKRKKILHKHSQNKYSFPKAFLFLSFYFHLIHSFCFPKNKKADNICKAI